MAEAVMSFLGKGRFRGYSAGSHPAGQVHPITLELLKKTGYPTTQLQSKGWELFARADAPVMDFVFTVCDKAAGEVCPIWPGQPISAHWGFEDPVACTGSEAERRRIFEQVLRQITTRINLLTCLPVEKLDRLALQREVEKIGRTRV
jgi:arsenate reductase